MTRHHPRRRRVHVRTVYYTLFDYHVTMYVGIYTRNTHI